MNRPQNRRQFLATSSCAFGAAAAGAAALPAAATRAMEPIARAGDPHFKFSLAAYSYRDLLQGDSPSMSLGQFLDDCTRFGLDGAELTSYYLPQEPSAQFLHELKGAAFRRGLDVSGTAVRNDFCFPSGERRDAELAHVKRWIEYADKFDAPVIRIFSGDAKSGQPRERAQIFAVEGIEECCRHAAEFGVYLALENHGGLTANVDEMLKIVRAVESPWFGVNLDTGNFHSADVYADLAKIAPYAINVQVKVAIQPKGEQKQPVDFKRLAAILREAGYQGYVVLEFEEAGDPRSECERYLDELREAFA